MNQKTEDKPYNSKTPEPCKHGHPYYCGLCEADRATKCKHGHAFYCGFCGQVEQEGS